MTLFRHPCKSQLRSSVDYVVVTDSSHMSTTATFVYLPRRHCFPRVTTADQASSNFDATLGRHVVGTGLFIT